MASWGFPPPTPAQPPQKQPEPARDDWPLMAGGKDIWRSAILKKHELPWFWHCPHCDKWERGPDAAEVKKAALAHLGNNH
jgi:hypothetical protein